MKKLKKITIDKNDAENIAYIIGDKEASKIAQKAEYLFELKKAKEIDKVRPSDSLVEIEIALRRCKRLGVFDK